MKSNHQSIVDRAAQNQHLWKFSAELSHRSDSFLLSINEFKKLMRQIARHRSNDDYAVVEYAVHLIHQTDETINLKFVGSLPLSQKTGDEIFIHEAELDAIVHSLWEGDVLHFAAFDSEQSVSIADHLGYPASGTLATKMVMSKGVITGHAGTESDASCVLCGE
jgi:hypothetical protein